MRLEPGFKDISPREIISFLLRATDQSIGSAVNPAPILELLSLRHISIDFQHDLPEAVSITGDQPRALLSFSERVVATETSLSDTKARFSTFHEIGHYVLPLHVESIVLCSERDMGFSAHAAREIQANSFAADLMFHGDEFTLEANSHKLCAQTVKELALKYKASFESTARMIVEKNIRPCMLVVFKKMPDDQRIDINRPPQWQVRYCVPSISFSNKYFTSINSFPDTSDVTKAALNTDIAESVCGEASAEFSDGRVVDFSTEYFSNSFNVFCLLQPKE